MVRMRFPSLQHEVMSSLIIEVPDYCCNKYAPETSADSVLTHPEDGERADLPLLRRSNWYTRLEDLLLKVTGSRVLFQLSA